jgi:anaerobic ribonucleoside-triphosphate reductase activating protein
MFYGEIKKNDIANGPGVRVSLFVSGCTHHCKNCFNEATWDFNFGQEFTDETEKSILEALKPDYIQGFTLLGGEPFEHVNQQRILPLLRHIREAYPEKNIWAFTGYLFDKDLIDSQSVKWPETMEILKLIDVIVDGRYVEELKSLSLKFKGSSNQRTIDVKESLETGKVVLLPGY